MTPCAKRGHPAALRRRGAEMGRGWRGAQRLRERNGTDATIVNRVTRPTLSLFVCILAAASCARSTKERHVLPADFRGPVIVVYGCSSAQPSPSRDGVYTLQVPASGVLLVPEPFGNVRSQTFFIGTKSGSLLKLPVMIRGTLPKEEIVERLLRGVFGVDDPVAEDSGTIGVYRLELTGWYEGPQKSTMSPNRMASAYCVGNPQVDGACYERIESKRVEVEDTVRGQCGPPA